MAEASVDSPAAAPSSAAVYIVYTEKPADGVELEPLYLQTLSSVLGSEEAAKSALIYVYKNAASGFSAKLTPDQVSELKSMFPNCCL